MPLQSNLFNGDPQLEAAAVNDSSHIIQGARGDHVGKIQTALILLDGARMVQDSIYGTETAAAVLAYKKKRGIVNLSYEKAADDIVGKMTISSLDREIKNLESSLGGRLCNRREYGPVNPNTIPPL